MATSKGRRPTCVRWQIRRASTWVALELCQNIVQVDYVHHDGNTETSAAPSALLDKRGVRRFLDVVI